MTIINLTEVIVEKESLQGQVVNTGRGTDIRPFIVALVSTLIIGAVAILLSACTVSMSIDVGDRQDDDVMPWERAELENIIDNGNKK